MFQCCQCPGKVADGEVVVSQVQPAYPKVQFELPAQHKEPAVPEASKLILDTDKKKMPELVTVAQATRRAEPVMVHSSSSCCSLNGFQALFKGSKKKAMPSAPTLLETIPAISTKPVAPPSPDAEKEQFNAIEEQVPRASASREEVAPPEVVDTPPARPELSGRWKLSRVEGDMEQKLKDEGLNWAIRKIVKGMNYGAGQAFQVISLSGNSVQITDEIPTQQPRTMAFVVGQDWKEVAGFSCAADAPPDAKAKAGKAGQAVLLKAYWDAEVLIINTKALDGQTMPDSRRWLDPKTGDLVLGSTTSTGTEVRQFWAKQ